MSFLPQRVSFPDTLTGRDVVEFYRRLALGDLIPSWFVAGSAAVFVATLSAPAVISPKGPG